MQCQNSLVFNKRVNTLASLQSDSQSTDNVERTKTVVQY